MIWHDIKRLAQAILLVVTTCSWACSNPTAVKTPPSPGIAQVVLLSQQGVVFTGKALPGEKLVAQVLDSAGHIVTDATLTASVTGASVLPPYLYNAPNGGWAVRGDTVIAPPVEGFGAVTITATRTDPSAATSDTAVIASTVNLGALHLTGTDVMCRVNVALYLAEAGGNWARYQGPIAPSTGYPIDSLLVHGIHVDSVNYAGSGDWRLTNGGWNLLGLIYWQGTSITYYENVFSPSGPSGTFIATFGWNEPFFRGDVPTHLLAQAPGTFIVLGTFGDTTVVNDLVAPYTFDGTPFCEPANDAGHELPTSSVTLTVN